MKLENIEKFEVFMNKGFHCIACIDDKSNESMEVPKHYLNKLFGAVKVDSKIIELYKEGICIDYCLKFKNEKTAIKYCEYINQLLIDKKIEEEIDLWIV